MQLRAQAQIAEAKLRGTSETSMATNIYDAMRLRARVLRGYKGSVTRQDIKTMHYKEFFGLVRELSLMVEEENEAAKGTENHQGNSSTFGELPRPQQYVGETFRLI
jgi:hypothetical protein